MGESFPRPFGRYKLLSKLAQGGMAEIFLAQDERGNIVAIKRILPHLAQEESFIRMFIDEARIVSHLDHPNVAAVYDQGKEEGYYFIVMEFVQGHSLLALSEQAKGTRMELPRGLLAFVVAELLAGLGCAHAAHDAKGRHLGIVHRDVTPQNVLISYEGEVKLVDFGVAKARARLTQTEAGFTKGKLAYMSPEQARGETLDGRSDLFSVGIILHEITTNQRLFNKEGPGGILGAIVNDPIPRPSAKVRGYPAPLEAVVMRALDKDVDARYQTAEEMRTELMRVARRERPAPTRQRLSELVHDLFGPSDNQDVIDRAREQSAPTPTRVPSLVDAPAVDPMEPEPTVRPDDTRMFEADAPAAGSARIEITRPSEVAVSHGEAPSPVEDPAVPEPETPWRVRLGRFISELGRDLRLSWRENQRRWWLGGMGAVAATFLVLVVGTGIAKHLAGWMEDALVAAREVKTSAGLVESPPPPPTSTVLLLASDPPGASISIDGVGMGEVTPHLFEGLPLDRPISVELTLAGYRPVEEALTLRPGQGRLEERFRLERRFGRLRITSDPPGARIRLDGTRRSEVTPTDIGELPAGATVRVELQASGRVTKSAVVVVPEEGVRELHLSLAVDAQQIPEGEIHVESTPGSCPAFIDDEPVGLTPATVAAKPGLHVVRVECEHHAVETRSVSVLSRSTAQVRVAARPTTFGYLSVELRPAAGTTVEINGRAVTPPVRFLKVVPGRHVIRARNTRLAAEKVVSVDIRPNARVTRTLTLTH
ncbi:MAG: protein kinase [Myxococcota bacterium]